MSICSGCGKVKKTASQFRTCKKCRRKNKKQPYLVNIEPKLPFLQTETNETRKVHKNCSHLSPLIPYDGVGDNILPQLENMPQENNGIEAAGSLEISKQLNSEMMNLPNPSTELNQAALESTITETRLSPGTEYTENSDYPNDLNNDVSYPITSSFSKLFQESERIEEKTFFNNHFMIETLNMAYKDLIWMPMIQGTLLGSLQKKKRELLTISLRTLE